jgi:hypothetical protein
MRVDAVADGSDRVGSVWSALADGGARAPTALSERGYRLGLLC